MANEKHLAILDRGVDAWNEWRKQCPEILPDLLSADLKGRGLSEINFYSADLSHATLAAANLQRGDFRFANLIGANLNSADLRHALLVATQLSLTDLSGADLRNANLLLATLCAAELQGANWGNALIGGTSLGLLDLRFVKGLKTVRFDHGSSIGIDTLYASQGDIPLTFLGGANVPYDFLKFFSKSVLAQWKRFSSCFISYSNKDRSFAQRIYRNLQREGVQCWFPPEDMTIGGKIRRSLDKAVRSHEKLLVVLSRHSINSPWVEEEVETALAEERKSKRTILFPIRLDDAAMRVQDGWPALIGNTRHIGDFRDWNSGIKYRRAFQRLLRDLKASESGSANAPLVDFRSSWESFWGERERSKHAQSAKS